MATMTFNRFNSFPEAAMEKVHNLGADTLKMALTNVAPVATNTQFSQITDIAAGNGYTAGGETVTVSSSTQTSGTYTCVLSGDTVWTASGGNIAEFRYQVLYNDTATNDELIGYWDIGAAQNITAGSTYTSETDAVSIMTVAPSA